VSLLRQAVLAERAGFDGISGEEELSDEEFMEKVIIGADPAHHAERIRELADMGATVAVLKNCSAADPERAIEVYGEQVLPRLREG